MNNESLSENSFCQNFINSFYFPPVVHISVTENEYNIMGTANGKPELREEDVQALMRTSNKTEAQVKDSFNRFLEDHPTGEIDHEGFKDLMREALPAKDAK